MQELERLRQFDRVAETRHFGRASEECHVSQPTLSRAIGRLESDLGVRLFDRDRRGVAPTVEGVRFGRFVRAVLDLWEEYEQGDGRADLAGTLSIFCTVTAAQTLVPDLLRQFSEDHPQVHLSIETGYAAEAMARVESGAVDVSIAPLSTPTPRHLVAHEVAQTPLVLVTSADGPHRLPRRPSATWGRVPFVLPTTSFVRTMADAWFRRLRVRPTVAAEVAGHEAVLSLVSLGVGIGLVPELVATGSPLATRLEAIPVAVPLPTLHIGACTATDRLATPIVDAFWSTLSGPGQRPPDR